MCLFFPLLDLLEALGHEATSEPFASSSVSRLGLLDCFIYDLAPSLGSHPV